MIFPRICNVDVSGSSYVNERDGTTNKKINIESYDVFELFENTKKIKPTQISTTLQHMPKGFQIR